jgi:hypothetical protein
MKKVYFIIGTIFTSLITSCGSEVVGEVTEQTCIATEVEYFQVGEKHTLQTDPEWRVKLDCGRTYTSRKAVRVGDSIQIKIVKYKK